MNNTATTPFVPDATFWVVVLGTLVSLTGVMVQMLRLLRKSSCNKDGCTTIYQQDNNRDLSASK